MIPELAGVVLASVAIGAGVWHHRHVRRVDRMSREWCDRLRVDQARAAGGPVENVWIRRGQHDTDGGPT